MITMNLSYRMIDCPRSWQNFVHHLQQKYGCVNLDISKRNLARELQPYHARYVSIGLTFDYVEFGSEKDYAWFLLRWS